MGEWKVDELTRGWLTGFTIRSHTPDGCLGSDGSGANHPPCLIIHMEKLQEGQCCGHLSAQPAWRPHCLDTGQDRGSIGVRGLTWDYVALDFVRDGTKGLTSWAIWLGPLVYQKYQLCVLGSQSLIQSPGSGWVKNSEVFRFFKRQGSASAVTYVTPPAGNAGTAAWRLSSSQVVWLFVTPWTAARQASLSLTTSQSLPKFMFMPKCQYFCDGMWKLTVNEINKSCK